MTPIQKRSVGQLILAPLEIGDQELLLKWVNQVTILCFILIRTIW